MAGSKKVFSAVLLIILCITGWGQEVAASRAYTKETAESEAQVEIPVLLYHHILKSSEIKDKSNPMIISLEDFERQMKVLKENNYKTITLKQMEKFVKGELKLPGKSVLITFDDGYQSNYRYAYPVLKKYSFHAAVFLVTAWCHEKAGPFNPAEMAFLSWDEIRKSRDVFEYASHTHHLHKYDAQKGSRLLWESRETVKSDLKISRDKLKTAYFAYPFGKYNEQVISLLKESGFRMAFTTAGGRVKAYDNLYKLNRFTVFSNTGMSSFKKYLQIGTK